MEFGANVLEVWEHGLGEGFQPRLASGKYPFALLREAPLTCKISAEVVHTMCSGTNPAASISTGAPKNNSTTWAALCISGYCPWCQAKYSKKDRLEQDIALFCIKLTIRAM